MFSQNYDYETSLSSECTTAPVNIDMVRACSRPCCSPVPRRRTLTGTKHSPTTGSRACTTTSRRYVAPVCCSAGGPPADVALLAVDLQNKTFESIPAGNVNTYYLQRPGSKNEKIVAPPAGLRMVAGNPYRRTFNASNFEDQAVRWGALRLLARLQTARS